MATYPMHVAGLDRDFPICKVTDDLYIGAFIMFGDAELTVRCAEELLKLAEGIDYDYLFTAEAKSIPLIHEMARRPPRQAPGSAPSLCSGAWLFHIPPSSFPAAGQAPD